MTASASTARVRVDATATTRFAPDYADAFRVRPVPAMPALDWARLSLRGAAAHGGLFRHAGLADFLGFHLAGRDEPGTIVGWCVTETEPRRVELDADGRLMAGRMSFEVAGDGVTWTTMLRFHHRLAGPTWSVAGPVHRYLAPRSLDAAAPRRGQPLTGRFQQRAGMNRGTTVRQLVYDSPGTCTWHEVPEPELTAPGQALVRPVAVACCDLDVAVAQGSAPLAPAMPRGMRASPESSPSATRSPPSGPVTA